MPLTYINLAIGTASETLVRTMQISLIDSGLVSRAHQATYDQIMKVRGGQGAKELEQQKQRPIPKL